MAFSNPIVGGTTLIREAIHSPNYAAGVSGWSINRDGSAEFADATVRGNVIVTDPATGSEVVIDVVNLIGAAVEIYPPGGAAAYPVAGRIFGDQGLSLTGALDITSPSSSAGYSSADILMTTSSPGTGATIALQAPGDGVYASDALYVVSAGGTTLKVCPSWSGISAAATTSGADTTTSATYVNMAGTGSATSLTFVKQQDDTAVRVRIEFGAFVTTAIAGVDYGFRVNSLDFQVGRFLFNTTAQHLPLSSTGGIAAGALAAGTYTVQARWKRYTGTGTLNRNADDWLAMTVEECP